MRHAHAGEDAGLYDAECPLLRLDGLPPGLSATTRPLEPAEPVAPMVALADSAPVAGPACHLGRPRAPPPPPAFPRVVS